MCAEEHVKRISPPKFIEKVDFKKYRVKVKLNQVPEYDWIKLFRNPEVLQPMEVYPNIVEFNGNEITWITSEDKVKENIEWLDKYIEHANEKYAKLLAEREEEWRKAKEIEKQKQAELANLSDKYKDL
jgi:hypothetical protein